MSHIPPLYTLKEPSPTSDPAGDDVDLGDMLKIVQFGGEKMMMKMFGALSQEELIQLQLALNKNRCDGDVAGFNASCFDDEEFVNAITLLLKFYEKAASEVPMRCRILNLLPHLPHLLPSLLLNRLQCLCQNALSLRLTETSTKWFARRCTCCVRQIHCPKTRNVASCTW